MIKHLVFLILLPLPALSGEMYISWTDPDMRANGEPFIEGEFQGSLITYYRQHHTPYTLTTEADSLRISGLKNGWWTVQVQARSHCATSKNEHSAVEDFLSREICLSEPTPSLRVKVQ